MSFLKLIYQHSNFHTKFFLKVHSVLMFTTGITLQVSVLGRRGPWLFFTDVSRGPWTESGTYVSFQMLLNESHHRWLTQPRNGPHSCNAEEAGEVFSLPETNVPFRQRGQMSPSILSAFQGACGTSCVILINDVELIPSPSLSYFYFLLIYHADKRQFIPFPRVGWLFSSYYLHCVAISLGRIKTYS